MEKEDISIEDLVVETKNSEYFDVVIGHIEDIVMSDKFNNLHENFLEQNWQKIENKEENKLEYMDIFEQYGNTFERFFIDELSRRMEHFDMERFTRELAKSNVLLDSFNNGEIFELLHSFTNFQAFKEIILAYRSEKEGNNQHLDFNILVTKAMSPIVVEDVPISDDEKFDITNLLEGCTLGTKDVEM